MSKGAHHVQEGSPGHSLKKAVALKYNPNQAQAPVVIAKGTGKIAEDILNKAEEYGIPVQEDPSLVEVLSKLDLDQEIPPEFYQLVAEILTFIYRSDNRMNEIRKSQRVED